MLNIALAEEYVEEFGGENLSGNALEESVRSFVRRVQRNESPVVIAHLRQVIDGRTVFEEVKKLISPQRAAPRRSSGDTLEEFAAEALRAAKTSKTGRWHGSVFISHVWSAMPGDMSLSAFKKRLLEAFRADLLELSRADLVDAMPIEDVIESELHYGPARFHFLRLEG